MADRSRSRYVRSRQQPGRAWRPPLPQPDEDQGHEHCPVPFWEIEFCRFVGNVTWKRFCENKRYVSIFNDLEHWDDSGACENFQNVKSRFWADYHGQPSNIRLLDRDMYIDKVNHHSKVDPELVADLDKVGLPFDSDNNPTPATISANAREDNRCTQNQPGNWAVHIEKLPKLTEWEAMFAPNATWVGNNESSSKWRNSNSGWGAALEKPSWCSRSNYQYASNNRYTNFYGGSNNNRYWVEDLSHASGKKQNTSGYSHQNTKQTNQDESFLRGSRQVPRRTKKEWRPVHNRACQSGKGIEGGS